MMSYTMACTSSCSIGGRLMRRMSPWTRISGGSPADRCRSDALFLTANARSSVISMGQPPDPDVANRAATCAFAEGAREWARDVAAGARLRAAERKTAYRSFPAVFIGGNGVMAAMDRCIKRTVVCNTCAKFRWCLMRGRLWDRTRKRGKSRASASTHAVRAAGRPPASVRLLAVSKTFPAAAIRAVHASGQRAFGENYVQEASRQARGARRSARHRVAPDRAAAGQQGAGAAAAFDWIETIDRPRIAERLSRRARRRARRSTCWCR